MTDSTAHNFTLTVTARHRLPHTTPHTHTIPRSFLHVHQQGARQVDEAYSHHYDHAVGVSHPLRRGRRCAPVNERWRFGFLQYSQPPISFLNGFFDTTDPVTVTPTHDYCAPAPDFRIPLPASCIQQRHPSACRPNERRRSVGWSVLQPNKPGQAYMPSNTIISPLFLETFDRYV